tara:strand:- start:92 stop:682 length:591 start_codon:yes stop_codon:yes gene_type:complete
MLKNAITNILYNNIVMEGEFTKKFNRNIAQLYTNRVDLIDGINGAADYKSIEVPKEENQINRQIMRGIQSYSKLNQLFFSQENINLLQDMIRYSVFIHTNEKHTIGKQNETELAIIMRYIFIQHSKNLCCKYTEQITELNKLVVKECVPIILTSIEQYFGYIKAASTNPEPMERSQNVNSAGTKTYDLTQTFNTQL